MAHHKSAKKRIPQSEKKRIRNRHIRTTMRSALKKFEQTLEAQNAEELKSLLDKTIATVDKAAPGQGRHPQGNRGQPPITSHRKSGKAVETHFWDRALARIFHESSLLHRSYFES